MPSPVVEQSMVVVQVAAHWLRFYFVEFSYLFASIFFIVGLKSLSHPDTARRGMHLAEIGMLLAIIGTLLHKEIVSYEWIIIAS